MGAVGEVGVALSGVRCLLLLSKFQMKHIYGRPRLCVLFFVLATLAHASNLLKIANEGRSSYVITKRPCFRRSEIVIRLAQITSERTHVPPQKPSLFTSLGITKPQHEPSTIVRIPVSLR